MKKVLFLARRILWIFICLGCMGTHAATYYFAANGDDSRNSTQAQSASTPWKSINKLNAFFSSLQPGDYVLFNRGDVFLGDILTNKSGTAAAPIVIGAYGTGPAPEITGFTTVTGTWTLIDAAKGIYESSVISGMNAGKACRVVTINGQVYEIGRYPNADADNGGYLSFEAHSTNTLTDNHIQMDQATWAGAEIGFKTIRYTFDIGTVDSLWNPQAGSTTYRIMQRSLDSFAAPSGWTDGYGYILLNNPATLDKFGEWYYNSATQKLRVCFAGSTPDLYTVKVSSLDKIIEPRNSNIVFRDIKVTGSNISGVWNDWPGITNQQYINCTFAQHGLNGLMLANKKNVLIDSCLFDWNLSGGVSVGYKDTAVTVSNCMVNHTGLYLGCLRVDDRVRVGDGIFYSGQANSKGSHIFKDTVLNSGYMGIFFDGDSSVIEYNYVDSSNILIDDGAGIYNGNYTPPGQTPKTNYGDTIRYNISMHAIGAPYGVGVTSFGLGNGFYLDDNSNHVTFYGNTSAHNSYNGLYVHNGFNHSIRNNVFFNNGQSQLSFADDNLGADVVNNEVKYNQMQCLTSSQLIYYLASVNNNFSTFATIDSNYISQPFNTVIASRNWYGQLSNCCATWTPATWPSGYNYDIHSKGSPVPVTNPYNIMFHVAGSKSLSLPFSCMAIYSLDGIEYTNGYTVNPYSSTVLVKQ